MTSLNVKEQDLLKRVDENDDLKPLFFRKVKGIKWFDELQNKGYFKPSSNPRPTEADEEGYFRIPHWEATDYLVKTAPELSSQDDPNYSKQFLEILISTTDYAKKNEFSNYRTWWQFAQVLSQVPPEEISVEDLQIVDYWLDDRFERGMVAQEIGVKWLPALLNSGGTHEHELAAELISIIYKAVFVDREQSTKTIRDANLRVDHHYAQKITKTVSKLAGRTLGVRAVEIFDEQLRRILTELNNDSWSSMWQPAIEDHDQNKYREDAENILIEAYRDSLDGLANSDPDVAFDYVSELLSCEFETIRRLAIHTIDENFRLCGELADTLIEEQYFGENYRHEMWRLLNRNYGRFNSDQKGKVLSIISAISRTDDEGEPHQTATAYSHSVWLSAVSGFGSKENDLYVEAVRVAGTEPDHPSFSSFMSSGWVVHESPIPLDTLQGMEIDQLAETLRGYRDQDQGSLSPGIEGLSKAVRELIKAVPLKYYSKLGALVDLDPAYVHQIIEAYKELWVERQKLPWDDIWASLLRFCGAVTSREEFWSEEFAEERAAFVANRFWVVSSIGRLIEAGVKSDDHAFDEKYLEEALSIVISLLGREQGNKFDASSDAVSISINSPRGHCLEALINLSLRSCRLADRQHGNDHTNAWAQFQEYFDLELDRNELPEYEFVTLVTNYLPNFLYMSTDWTIARLDKIFDQSDRVWWLCAMQGYAYVGTVYEQIFAYLKKRGHFLLALDDEDLGDRVRERIIQNIGVAYMSDFEELTDQDSLIGALVARGSYEEQRQLIWFMWTKRKENDPELRAKIYELWPRILSTMDVATLEGRRLASHLCHWAVFVNELDDERLAILSRIAPFSDVEHNSYDLLQSLAGLSKEQPFEAHAVWMKLLEGSTPDYPEEAVRDLLANLEARGPEGLRKAKEAVSVYLKFANDKPQLWLRQISNGEQSEESQ